MKISNLLTLSSVAALLGSVAATAPVAMAQAPAAEEIEEVVIIGSRRAPRTALDSAAPVDVFSASDFQDQGTADMNDLLRNLVPTFNVDVQDINDSSSLVRPATLRGLPADDTLVLVNGKRPSPFSRCAVRPSGHALRRRFPDSSDCTASGRSSA
jgi:iron complex outermembrane receptor protein